MPAPCDDYYALLEVGRDATQEEIKKGYKKMAIKWHPDKHASAGNAEKAMAEEKFKAIAEAYDTLSDPSKKDVYDRHGAGAWDILKRGGDGAGPAGFRAAIDPMDLFYQMFEQMKDPNGVNGDTTSKKEQRAASEGYRNAAGDDELPPAGLRFAFDGAAYHEGAVLHGLAAPYEGLFRLSTREINGKPAYRHALRSDRWIAFNGSGWMAQNERALGTKQGVLLLKDRRGHFDGGSAHGGGVYYDRKGSVHSGSWVGNKRVGVFEVVDPAGNLWEDVYDDSGARTARKKKGGGGGSPAGGSCADFCKLCGVKFHGEHNYSCRRHLAEFDGQRWACCGAASLEEPGCQVEAAHEA